MVQDHWHRAVAFFRQLSMQRVTLDSLIEFAWLKGWRKKGQTGVGLHQKEFLQVCLFLLPSSDSADFGRLHTIQAKQKTHRSFQTLFRLFSKKHGVSLTEAPGCSVPEALAAFSLAGSAGRGRKC